MRRIKTSLLGREEGVIRCRRVIRVGLEFGDVSPLEFMYEILEKRGMTSPEELRDLHEVPPMLLLVRIPKDGAFRLNVTTANADEILRQALILGLSTAQIFDPRRPVIWTTASLTRGLELFDPEGFYA